MLTRLRAPAFSGICIAALLTTLFAAPACVAQPAGSRSTVYPDTTWMQYASLEEAGWSSAGISEARTRADSLGSKAVMLIYNGAIVTEWGDISGRAPVYSIRKSLLSALYGIYIAEGKIDTSATLADLEIDDTPPLTEEEKQARVADLLTSSSGVYHKAAYEGSGTWKPQRGSAEPGQQWFYNNWDFNALGTIFEQETGTRIWEAFEQQVAGPVGMEDFQDGQGAYHLQPDRSEHPAYIVRMSARDMARFGLLYLREGRWEDKQVVPPEWVEESTRPHWKNVLGENYEAGYGLMWWVRGGRLGEYGTYLASGSGNQSIIVVPDLNIVFVHRATADLERGVSGVEAEKILLQLIDARVENVSDQPQLVPLTE